ncbi:hypothetical protein V1264_004924 [Littorina saxatilis]|uniref:Uncharacterized protein n=1 Tax=Littorina saxatilis TaxID=31220 RepID=A0AAN9B592_9CAEN
MWGKTTFTSYVSGAWCGKRFVPLRRSGLTRPSQTYVRNRSCILALTLWKVDGDCDGGDVDGCTNFYFYDTYEAIFTPACNRHDVCYGCGAKFNYDQAKCDRIFYNHMLAACRSNYASGTNNREKCEERSVRGQVQNGR